MKQWIWRGLAFELPVDWEMLQFSKERQEGRCAFADRMQYRLELNWRVVPGAPDFDRTISDLESRLTAEQGLTRARRIGAGEWRGLDGRQAGARVSRLGRYFAEARCMVELVFLWPGARESKLERAVCDSMRCEAGAGARRWRAYGMDMLAGEGHELAECSVEPANVRLKFGRFARGEGEEFRRMGMVSEWLRDDVAVWLGRQGPVGARMRTAGTRVAGRHRIEWAGGTIPGAGIRMFAGLRDAYGAAAWLCPADGRLYSVSVTRRKAQDPAAMPGIMLTCCDELGKTA